MFSQRKRFRVGVFALGSTPDVNELENVKQNVLDKVPGWSIQEQQSFSNKDGEFFVYLEWTEPQYR